jgi:maltose alpha-D-glucosyltransferase/alpha-amylase
VTAGQPEARVAAEAWIAGELPRLAPEWLPGQRWFGGKARRIDSVGIDDVLWLEPALAALVILDVRYAEQGSPAAPPSDRYALIAAVRGSDADGSIIGRMPERSWTFVDAPGDRLALDALLAGLIRPVDIHGTRGGRLVHADATARTRRLLEPGLPRVAPLTGEQSNTSVRVGDTHVFKLFRRLEDGRHPQLEISRQLAAQGFAATPPLDGSLVYERGGLARAIGALEGWVENAGDGWRYVLGRLGDAAPGSAEAGRLAADLKVLGTTTAEFHLALAADEGHPDFAPRPVTAAEWRAWRGDLEAQAARTFDLVAARHAEWPEAGAGLARDVLAARPRLAGALERAAAAGGAGFHCIRIHGDYHLGQVLKTPDGYAVIDFEGEPSKPLAERLRRHCALKDIAGMLRSFDYAAATAVPAAADRSAANAWMRTAFVDGYRQRARAGGAVFLPPSQAAADALTEMFEMEKALYEVEYEANNRPDWVGIPLSAVARLLEAAGPASRSAGGGRRQGDE